MWYGVTRIKDPITVKYCIDWWLAWMLVGESWKEAWVCLGICLSIGLVGGLLVDKNRINLYNAIIGSVFGFLLHCIAWPIWALYRSGRFDF